MEEITDNTVANKRQKELAQKMPPRSLALLFSADECSMDQRRYRYHQNSHFFYMTQFQEPSSVFLIEKNDDHQFTTTIFCRPKDLFEETWNGKRLGYQNAASTLSMNAAFSIDDFWSQLPHYLKNKKNIFYDFTLINKIKEKLFSLLSQLTEKNRADDDFPQNIINIHPIISKMRMIKSSEEINNIRHACAISIQAHRRAMQFCQPDLFEYQLEAELHHEFLSHGAFFPAYGSIVAGGENACILHYTENRHQLKSGDLLLIDAGCEWKGYASDITRTFPVNGTFSEPQKAIYELVLHAQESVIKHLKPGVLWDQSQSIIMNIFAKGLVDLGILPHHLDSHSLEKEIKRFYMHGAGHFLGLDVHDVGSTKVQGNPIALEPGMVFTVEPGLYFAIDDDTIDKKWRGIGVRIEDNVLITPQGCDIITHALPKSVKDIENLMKKKTH